MNDEKEIDRMVSSIADIGVEYGVESMENGGFDETGYVKEIDEAKAKLLALKQKWETAARVEELKMAERSSDAGWYATIRLAELQATQSGQKED